MSEGLTVAVIAAAAAVIAAAASFVGVLIGAAIPAALSWGINSRQRKDDLGYLAVTVSAAMETYIAGCIDVMFDSGVMHNYESAPRVKSPDLELKSLDVNWRSIPVDLLDRIFAIPNAQQIIRDKISWEAENSEYPILLRQVEYGMLAEKALAVLTALRRAASLSAIPEGRPDYAGMVREHLPDLKTKHAKAEAAQLSWISDFGTGTTAPESGSTESTKVEDK